MEDSLFSFSKYEEGYFRIKSGVFPVETVREAELHFMETHDIYR